MQLIRNACLFASIALASVLAAPVDDRSLDTTEPLDRRFNLGFDWKRGPQTSELADLDRRFNLGLDWKRDPQVSELADRGLLGNLRLDWRRELEEDEDLERRFNLDLDWRRSMDLE